MTQGQIERYHRSLKSVVKLEHYDTPWEMEWAAAYFVEDRARFPRVTAPTVFLGETRRVSD